MKGHRRTWRDTDSSKQPEKAVVKTHGLSGSGRERSSCREGSGRGFFQAKVMLWGQADRWDRRQEDDTATGARL